MQRKSKRQLPQRADGTHPRVTSDSSVASADTRISASRWALSVVKPYLLSIGKYVSPAVVGVSSAAALTSDRFVVIYYLVTVAIMFLVLIRTFWGIVQSRNMTLVHRPLIYNADGSTTNHDPVSVFQYDKQVASYYASEFPAFAVAAAWFYVWTNSRYIMIVYAGYIAYRVLTHPLFRIHVWQEPHSVELGRPFGSIPLFQRDQTPVKVVEGLQAFETTLSSAPEGTLVVVDVSATWCAPCRAMAPTFELLALEYQSFTFVSIDIDVSQDIATRLEISSVPTFLIYKDGEQLEVLRGARPSELRAAIQNHM